MAGATGSRWSAERRYYGGMAVAMLASVFIGFARSFYLRAWFPSWPRPSEPVFYVHGVLFTAWMLLLVGQALLVGARRVDIHRRLGWAGAVLAGMVRLLYLVSSLVWPAQHRHRDEEPADQASSRLRRTSTNRIRILTLTRLRRAVAPATGRRGHRDANAIRSRQNPLVDLVEYGRRALASRLVLDQSRPIEVLSYPESVRFRSAARALSPALA